MSRDWDNAGKSFFFAFRRILHILASAAAIRSEAKREWQTGNCLSYEQLSDSGADSAAVQIDRGMGCADGCRPDPVIEFRFALQGVHTEGYQKGGVSKLRPQRYRFRIMRIHNTCRPVRE